MDQLELLLEAERRGILPPDKQELLTEARNRGMVPALEPKPAQQPTRSLGEEAGRQAGLTARYGVEGPMQLANTIVGDPATTLVNWGIRGVNALGGSVPELPLPSQVTEKYLGKVFPTPETAGEKIVGAVSKGMTAGGPVTKAAMAAPKAIAELPFIKSITSAPMVDIASQGIGGGASEAAKQGGLGPAWQLAAGAIAPMAFGTGVQAVKTAGTALNEIRRPITKAGAEQIAADVLGRIAQDKQQSLDNLAKYNALKSAEAQGGPVVGVPGSKPTSGAVSADYGLIGGEQLAQRGDAGPMFAIQRAQNNAARVEDLGRLNATEQALEAYRAKRDAITAPMREQAFAGQKAPVDYVPVAQKIADLAKTPAGTRAESQKALEWLSQRLVKNTDEGLTDAPFAYALHQDIGDLVAGKVKDGNGSALRLAGGLANEVKKTLADQIDAAAPGFKKYLEHYSRLSKPIDRLEIVTNRLGGQDLSKVTNAALQSSGGDAAYTLSQAKMRNQLGGIKSDLSAEGLKLAPRQSDVLERVLGDLNSSTLASTGGKPPGSDTYQNMAAANFMQRVLGDTLAGSGAAKSVLERPLAFVTRPLESRINDIVLRAYQDPKLMEELLRKARTARTGPTVAGLLDFTTPRTFGGLLGALGQ